MRKIFLIVALFFATQLVNGQAIYKENDMCLRCHSMKTLGEKDNSTGLIKSYYVNPQELQESPHADLNCVDCHSEDFKTFPHPGSALSAKPYCTDCHDEEMVIGNSEFGKIEESISKSVHGKLLKENFDCSSCHNPHGMKLRESLDYKIKGSYPRENQMCVECHQSNLIPGDENSNIKDKLRLLHSNVIKQNKNWNKMLCVECHTSNKDTEGRHLIN
jgi:predicted CXXCH cytochrome family protein